MTGHDLKRMPAGQYRVRFRDEPAATLLFVGHEHVAFIGATGLFTTATGGRKRRVRAANIMSMDAVKEAANDTGI